MDFTTTTYTIPTTATTTNTTHITSIPYAWTPNSNHNLVWAPLDTTSPREGRVWVDMCNKLLECFKEHFEHGDLDISEDEFWKIWNDG